MTDWLSQFFIHPGFVLPGLALTALPVIIHLINRMRYRRVRFAAMEFLLQSQQKNRRKLLLEQLLLLLLRILAVAFLVTLIARPFFDPSQLLILQGEKAHHVVLLDDSGSMSDRWGETTAFDSALEVVRKIAQEGARKAGTQNLTVLLLSHLDQPLVTQASLDPGLLNELEAKLENLKCSFRGLDLVEGLKAAGQHLQNPAAAKHLHVLADFRSRDWEADSAVASELGELDRAGVDINLSRSVPVRHANLGITELVSTVNVAAANVPLRLRTRIKNFGDQVVNNVRVAVLQNGQKLPLSVAIDQLEPDAEAVREFDVVFNSPGKHSLQVGLPADSLEADNQRFLTVDITPANPVLIIAGNLGNDEGLFLRDALAPTAGLTGFAPVIENVEFLRRQPLTAFGSIYLLDVPEIPADGLRALEDFVAGGGGLVWFMGPQVRPAFYSEKLFKNGQGLFPAPLGVISELTVDSTNPAPDLNFENHPIYRAFQGQDNPFVESVRVSKYYSLAKDWQPPSAVRVISRFRNKSPATLEHSFGAGKVITNLTTCGVTWNDWPRNPSFVLLQLELQQYVSKSLGTSLQRVVGDPIQIQLDPAIYRSQIEVRPPDATRIVRLNATVPTLNGGLPPVSKSQDTPAVSEVALLKETYRDTDTPGIYTLVRYKQDESTDPLILAFNVPIQESELEISSTEEIRRRLGPESRVRIQEYGVFDWIQGRQAGQEIRDLILAVILLILLAEQWMAMRLSFHSASLKPTTSAGLQKLRRTDTGIGSLETGSIRATPVAGRVD